MCDGMLCGSLSAWAVRVWAAGRAVEVSLHSAWALGHQLRRLFRFVLLGRFSKLMDEIRGPFFFRRRFLTKAFISANQRQTLRLDHPSPDRSLTKTKINFRLLFCCEDRIA